MSAWVCRGCTAVYSVGAPRCPQCGATDPIKEHEQMAKITVHGGPSDANAEPGPTDTQTLEVTPEEATEEGELLDVVDYNAFTVEELKAELKERKLAVSGSKDELVVRLAENDGEKLQADGDRDAE